MYAAIAVTMITSTPRIVVDFIRSEHEEDPSGSILYHF
jgi:hypothetical protein